jgi:hypothetical protein
MQNHKGHGMARRQPMTLQLQQQWRKDGERPDELSTRGTPAKADGAPQSEADRSDAHD